MPRFSMVLIGLILFHEISCLVPPRDLGAQELYHPLVHHHVVDDAVCETR